MREIFCEASEFTARADFTHASSSYVDDPAPCHMFSLSESMAWGRLMASSKETLTLMSAC